MGKVTTLFLPRRNEGFVFNIFADKKTNNLLNKLEENTIPLIELADFSLGITPYDKYKGHTKKQIENKEFHSNRKEDENYKKLISGGDIIRYGIFWDGKSWIKYGNWLGAPREKRFFTEPHIVVRQIVSGKPLRIYAGYAEEELINAQIGFNIITKDENKIKIKYLLALLNSKLINFYHTEKYLDKSKNLFQKILIQNAKKFPVKIPDSQTQREICELVNKRLELTKSLNNIGEKLTNERSKLEEEIKKIDENIDNIVYDLYRLSNEEKEIIKQS